MLSPTNIAICQPCCAGTRFSNCFFLFTSSGRSCLRSSSFATAQTSRAFSSGKPPVTRLACQIGRLVSLGRSFCAAQLSLNCGAGHTEIRGQLFPAHPALMEETFQFLKLLPCQFVRSRHLAAN